jgi:DNA-binding XRE family transcriptional regulator
VDVATSVQAMGARVRGLRAAAGLSQGELAARAGVSRQAVGALEAGRHLPRVDAALALALALGTTVEALVAPQPQQPVSVTGARIEDGQPVRLGRVGDRLIGVPVPSAGTGESFALPDAVVRGGVAALFDGADVDGFVLVGCDPALGLLAALGPSGPGRLLVVPGTTAVARDALRLGRAHAALVHGDAVTGAALEGVRRLRLASWRTGLAAPGGSTAIDDALEGRGPVVQRELGAAAQTAYLDALARRGLAAPPGGAVARGHLDAGRRALETGTAAVTMEPVARALGLAFHPLETHVAEIWLSAEAVTHPGTRTLGEVLVSAGFRSRVRAFEGYELEAVA